MQLIQAARRNIRSLLEQCNILYEVTPFDEDLYQECIDDAARRGYPTVDDPSWQAYLREGVIYAATAGGHLRHRPTQIWIALFTLCTIFVDDVTHHFPEETQDLYLFSDRFIRNELHGNPILNAYADTMRRTSELYLPLVSQLITTSTLNFVTANLLEYETRSMKISSAALRYPAYQRGLSGISETYAFMMFPRDIPLNDYIQAIPEMMLFINNVNDVLSFYKEELAGETTNQISTLAARTNKSKLETFGELTGTAINLHKRIVKILEKSPEACKAFKDFAGGYVRFHTSSTRYQLEDLDL